MRARWRLRVRRRSHDALRSIGRGYKARFLELQRGTKWRWSWYHFSMGTNLRLSRELADALREAAARSGRSQQDIVREAIRRELGLVPRDTEMEAAVRLGVVLAPTPFRDAEGSIDLPHGVTSLDLLDREDR